MVEVIYLYLGDKMDYWMILQLAHKYRRGSGDCSDLFQDNKYILLQHYILGFYPYFYLRLLIAFLNLFSVPNELMIELVNIEEGYLPLRFIFI